MISFDLQENTTRLLAGKTNSMKHNLVNSSKSTVFEAGIEFSAIKLDVMKIDDSVIVWCENVACMQLGPIRKGGSNLAPVI